MKNIEQAVQGQVELQVYFFEGATGKGKVQSFATAGEEHLRRERINGRRDEFEESQCFQAALQAGLGGLSCRERGDKSSPFSREVDRLFFAWLPQEDLEFLAAAEGLGNSQKAEVAWLERKGYSYTEVDVGICAQQWDQVSPGEPPPKAHGPHPDV